MAHIGIFVASPRFEEDVVIPVNESTYQELPLMVPLMQFAARLNATPRPQIGDAYFPEEEVRDFCLHQESIAWGGTKHRMVYWGHQNRTCVVAPFVYPCVM